ncbi:MAG: hypothetical protein PHS86_01570 [Syntrophaceae bacterium]|nr:hypothetical protein [Syntrophaceae bacterium]
MTGEVLDPVITFEMVFASESFAFVILPFAREATVSIDVSIGWREFHDLKRG